VLRCRERTFPAFASSRDIIVRMAFVATIYRVLVASPSDTLEFRDLVSKALVEWNDLNAEGYRAVLLPVMWEMSATPAVGGSPQSLLNDQIVDDTDIVIAVFWTRLGTPTENAQSGSVEEIRRKASQGAPVMLYFSGQPANPLTVDPDQLGALQEFKAEMEKTALLGVFQTGQELLHIVQRDITRTITKLQPPQDDGRPQQAPEMPQSGNAVPETQRILDSYKNQLRGTLIRRQAQFEGATPDFDSEAVRYALTQYSSDLTQLVGAVAAISVQVAGSPLTGRLIELSTRASRLGRLQMFLDGGQSWRNLTDGAEALFTDTAGLLAEDWAQMSDGPTFQGA
jgi:hypothetical protein